MLKKALLIAAALLLLALPVAARWFYFYEGQYEPSPVPRPDLSRIESATSALAPFSDTGTPSEAGAILVDLAHDNRIKMAELNILQARLAARGQRLEPVLESDSSSDLGGRLRYAKALLVISPGRGWTPTEIGLVEDFVEKGGRLLLIADPTRFDVLLDEEGALIGIDSDAAYINDLAARFGLVFQSDYLYNTVDNEGNFRNIRLKDFSEHELTGGLDQIVFYGVHSIVSEEPALISTHGETRSSNTERTGELTVGTLAAGGKVLALGDLTFMTEPYNDVYDNDQFISNVADFVSGAEREYGLTDFPFFFEESAYLVYAGKPLLDSELLATGSTLQSFFVDNGKQLSPRGAEDNGTDTLFLGLFGDADEVEPYLALAGVTLHLTGTLGLELDAGSEPAPTASPTPDPLAATPEMTATLAAGPEPSEGITVTKPLATGGRIEIDPLGELPLSGTVLFLVYEDGQRQVMAVLAETNAGLKSAVDRITKQQLDGCLYHTVDESRPASLVVCPVDEEAAWPDAGGEQGRRAPAPTPSDIEPSEPVTQTLEPEQAEPEATPEGELQGGILIVSLDDGQSRYDGGSGADDFAAILREYFEVTVWSKANDPPLDTSKLLDYDLIVWAGGDYEDALGDTERELLFLAVLNGTPVLVSGAYVGEGGERSIQRDLQVRTEDHPLARGFSPGEIIGFLSLPSGTEYEIDLQEITEEPDSEVVFVRGPASEDAGSSSIWVVKDADTDVQVVFIGFPIYLLPQEPRTRLVLNAVTWMLQP